MGRGQRAGALTRKVLLARLDAVVPKAAGRTANVATLLGYAKYHNLISDHELNETIPRIEATIPCYLFSHITDVRLRAAIDKYVLAASGLYRRGSYIANLLAIKAFGSSLPGPVRPRFGDEQTQEAADFIAMFFEVEDVRNAPIKQVFLPERWPTAEVSRHPETQAVLAEHGDVLPSVPDWRAVMAPCGWDNAINRMATKYFGNVKVHVMAGIEAAVTCYLRTVPLREGTSLAVMESVFRGPLYPATCVHNDDWELACRLRDAVGYCDDDVLSYLQPRFSPALCLLHLFLVRSGAVKRTYLPVVTRGRKYCYLDVKVFMSLCAYDDRLRRAEAKAAGEKPSRTRRVVPPLVAEEDPTDNNDIDTTTSIGELLGIDADEFNRYRKHLRRRIIKQHRQRAKDRSSPAKKRRRSRRLAHRWERLGPSKMRRGTRIDSIETDGVGLRLCVKTPIDLAPFVRPLPCPACCSKSNHTGESSQAGATARKWCSKAKVPKAPKVPKVDEAHATTPNSIHVGVDLGRAKPYTAAISRVGWQKPQTLSYTRHRCVYERMDVARRSWEQRRLQARPQVRVALDVLANTGGIRNAKLELWRAFLAADKTHASVLDAEFLDVERARWTMLKFRRTKGSLDRASARLMAAACRSEPCTRPLVLTIGVANFASTGKGEVPVPTAALSRALARAIARERGRGRPVVVQKVDEFRTTLCCCACGARTTAHLVTARKTRGAEAERRQSRRLRQCTECEPAGRCRDRDVQAARNILWLGLAMYLGHERPEYLRRPQRRVVQA